MRVAGLEYTLVGWCKHKWILYKEDELIALLRDVCEVAGMRPMVEISVNVDLQLEKLETERFEDEGGASASVILSTSHANIHGWPKRDSSRTDGGFFWFTIGSCREFNHREIYKLLDSRLGITSAESFKREIKVPVQIPLGS